MDKLFKNRFRIPSARQKEWDYSSAGAYFITICVGGGIHSLGKVDNGVMRMSEVGKIVAEEWENTPITRPDMNITLDEFCVMPNHFHAILIIGTNEYNQLNNSNSQFEPQRKNLASIIRGFKAKITSRAKKLHPSFAWQPRYYDRIIKDSNEYKNVRAYIYDNPSTWEKDKYYTIME